MSVKVSKINESLLRVICDEDQAYEIKDRFTFEVPNARYTPLFKQGRWDGKISLYNMYKKTLPYGLLEELKEFCEHSEYEIEIKKDVEPIAEWEHIDVQEFCFGLKLQSRGKDIVARDYQTEAILQVLNRHRITLISPTASGKSLIAYVTSRMLLEATEDVSSILVIVPTTQLVEQLAGDFADYSNNDSWDAEDEVHKLYSGKEKSTDKPIFCSTWQSLQGFIKGNPSWFEQFDAVIVDEVQGAKGKQLSTILELCTNAKYRVGLTGSLDGIATNESVIKGMLGPIHRVAHTRDLIDEGKLSDIKIKSIVLGYSPETKKVMGKQDYDREISFLFAHERRNKFIRNLALSLEGNTLIMVSRIESHGQIIFDMINDKKADDVRTFFAHGGVDVEDRLEIGEVMRKNRNVIAVAGYQVFQAGINIPEIDNIILAAPSKSIVRILQSIGRGLRKAEGKGVLTLFDIGDHLSKSSNYDSANHTYRHVVDRLKIYLNEQFSYKITEIQIE